jgi:hypothetical protein
MKGIIYCATNTTNGKKYIGATTRGIKARMSGHYCGSSSCRKIYFQEVLQSTPREIWEWEVLEENIPKEELGRKETFWIMKLDTFESGYNRNYGASAGAKIKKPYHFWHKEHGEFIGLREDCMNKIGAHKTTISALNTGGIFQHKGWVHIKNKGVEIVHKPKGRKAIVKETNKPIGKIKIYEASFEGTPMFRGTLNKIAPEIGVTGELLRVRVDFKHKSEYKLKGWAFELKEFGLYGDSKKGGKWSNVHIINKAPE